jgi:tryptophan synthase alpha chain
MSAVDELFQRLRESSDKAFMPFITAGDPDLDTTAELIQAMDASGCHLCELGIPFSDPIADGPTIQASYTRALNAGIKLDQILEMVGKVTPNISMPIVMMVSYAIIFRRGVDKSLADAKAAGISGFIVPDLPIEESELLAQKCAQLDLNLVQLITPTTPRDRAKEIAARASGFIYYVSVAGITGERTQLPADITDNLKWLREQTDLPICVGFGISGPEQVKLLAPHSDGLIVGSAIIRRIQDAVKLGESPAKNVTQFCKTILGSISKTCAPPGIDIIKSRCNKTGD